MNAIVRDNGWKSRKLAFCTFAVFAMLGFALLTAPLPALTPLFDTFVGGVVAVAGLFLTGSVATKWVGTKAPADPGATEPEAK